jgi:hypothetical protein
VILVPSLLLCVALLPIHAPSPSRHQCTLSYDPGSLFPSILYARKFFFSSPSVGAPLSSFPNLALHLRCPRSQPILVSTLAIRQSASARRHTHRSCYIFAQVTAKTSYFYRSCAITDIFTQVPPQGLPSTYSPKCQPLWIDFLSDALRSQSSSPGLLSPLFVSLFVYAVCSICTV